MYPFGFPARRIRPLPRPAPSGWEALLPPREDPARPLEGDHSADAVVLGAGFTGLAAARRLAELRPGWRIALVEADRAGSGASGRSSGFVVDVAFFTTRMAPTEAERHVRLSRVGIEALRTRVREDDIECGWDETGWLHAAAGHEGFRDLEILRRWLEEHGEPHEWLDGAAVERVTGTPFYRAAVRLPGRPLLQPAALVRGLVASLPAGVALHESSPVRRLEHLRRDRVWRLGTPAGSIRTPRLLVTTNGFTPALGVLGDRLFPLLTFASMTRPLTPGEWGALGGEAAWGVLAQDPMGSTLRRTPEGRILLRNTVAFSRSLAPSPRILVEARNAHRRALARRYPALAAVDLELTWEGVMGATPSRRHAFGAFGEGLWATAGFTGAGIAQGTIAGALLAELACGADSAALRDMLALPPPGRIPPRPFQDLGIRWRVSRMNAAARPTL